MPWSNRLPVFAQCGAGAVVGTAIRLAIRFSIRAASPAAALALLSLAAGPSSSPAAAQTGPAAPVQIAPRFAVVLDAAHGGPETGARLTDSLAEKTLVLDLSVRLRSLLTAHGIAVATTRERDANPTQEARAAVANRAPAAACLILHATTAGSGAHLYTSALAPSTATAGVKPTTLRSGARLRPWATAQADFLTQSLKLSSELSTALGHAGIPFILGQVSLAPIDTLACPAVIVEIAPLLPRRGRPGAPLEDPEYQTRLVDAIVGALEQWRADWKAQP